jgi:Zn-dependent metalloprotease
MKIFAYHAEDDKPVSKHREIDALATALRRVHLSKIGANQNQLKHQFKEVEDSLKRLLEAESIRGFVEPKTHSVKSEFESVSTQWLNLTKTHIVKFNQRYKNIPVYGAQVTVEVDEKNELLAINSAIGNPNGLNASPKVGRNEIKHLIEKKKGYQLGDIALNPTLYYYYDSKKDCWRLVYITDIRYKDPENQLTETEKHSQFKSIPEMVDYVIDAHTKEIVLELPRVRTLQKKLRHKEEGLYGFMGGNY